MPIAKPCDAPAPADNKNHVTWECPKCNWRKVQGVTCEQCRAWMVNVTAPADQRDEMIRMLALRRELDPDAPDAIVLPADSASSKCEHGVLWSMECIACPPQEYVAVRRCVLCRHEERFSDNEGGICEKWIEHDEAPESKECGCKCEFTSSVSEETDLVLLRSVMLRIVEVAQAGAKCVDANSDAAERFRWIADRAAARSAEDE